MAAEWGRYIKEIPSAINKSNRLAVRIGPAALTPDSLHNRGTIIMGIHETAGNRHVASVYMSKAEAVSLIETLLDNIELIQEAED